MISKKRTLGEIHKEFEARGFFVKKESDYLLKIDVPFEILKKLTFTIRLPIQFCIKIDENCPKTKSLLIDTKKYFINYDWYFAK